MCVGQTAISLFCRKCRTLSKSIEWSCCVSVAGKNGAEYVHCKRRPCELEIFRRQQRRRQHRRLLRYYTPDKWHLSASHQAHWKHPESTGKLFFDRQQDSMYHSIVFGFVLDRIKCTTEVLWHRFYEQRSLTTTKAFDSNVLSLLDFLFRFIFVMFLGCRKMSITSSRANNIFAMNSLVSHRYCCRHRFWSQRKQKIF